MATKRFSIIFTIFLCMFGTKAFAYDIAVENADGVIIYYNYINDGKELEVTWKDEDNSASYSGDIVIPDEVTYMNRTRKVTSIGSYAFEECNGLTSITIPNSVTSINYHAFYWCNHLTSVTIPNSVTFIEYGAFENCSGLKSVHISDLAAWCSISFDDFSSNPIYYAHHLFLNGTEVTDLVIPKSITSIGKYVFQNCSGLKSVNIHNRVISIGDYAFQNCSGLTSVNFPNIPNSMISIGSYAFDGCSGLTSVNIPNSVKLIGSYAFRDCSGLSSSITIPYGVISIGDKAFRNCSGLSSVSIPSSVTSIADYTFAGCSGLSSITIPSSVKSIDSWAFEGCSSLTSVTIPNSVTSIGSYAFEECSGLTSIDIPNSVTKIGESAFKNCSGLTSVNIPNSVTSIGGFEGCSGLTSIDIPNSVTSIGSFRDCSSLLSITIPDGVTSIGVEAFENCSSLTLVNIPNSVLSIGVRAFQNCSNLSSVTIPNSVTYIGECAFSGSFELLEVFSRIENPFAINTNVFTNNSFNNAILYVPTGTKEKYKATEGWKNFLFIEERKCEKPTISYQNGMLSFSCATEDATCQYSITDSDIKAGDDQEVQLDVTYNISVYATKSGYENSETATAILCWIEVEPSSGVTTNTIQISAMPVMIKAEDGIVSIEGGKDGMNISVYTIDGVQEGSATIRNGVAMVNTNIPRDSVAIVKIGNKSVKVIMK